MGERKEGQKENLSVQERYEIAKKEKPHLGAFTDRLVFLNFPFLNEIPDPTTREQVEYLITEQRLTFLDLCKHDVELNSSQKMTLDKILSKSIQGKEMKTDYRWGENMVTKDDTKALIIAATYINSL